MATREQLKQRGLRAYEKGRIMVALRLGWLVVPLTLLCVLATGAGEVCLCVGGLLLAFGVYLRWRDRSGQLALTTGLAAGTLPLLLGLCLGRLSPICGSSAPVSFCTALSVVVSLLSGLWLGALARRTNFGREGVLTAAGIALLVASFAWTELAWNGIVGQGAGLLTGVSLMLWFRR